MISNPYQSPNAGLTKKAIEPYSHRDKLLVVVTVVGLAHFFISVALWLLGVFVAVKQGAIIWGECLYSIPAFVLFFLFTSVAVLSRRRRNMAWGVLAIAVFLSLGCFFFDAVNHHYQIHFENMERGTASTQYCTWWWYNDRWFR
jgi:hypothetical protein